MVKGHYNNLCNSCLPHFSRMLAGPSSFCKAMTLTVNDCLTCAMCSLRILVVVSRRNTRNKLTRLRLKAGWYLMGT